MLEKKIKIKKRWMNGTLDTHGMTGPGATWDATSVNAMSTTREAAIGSVH